MSFAFSALLAALTESKTAPIKPREFLIVAGLLALAAVAFFIAHSQINQGRIAKKTKVREVPEESSS